MILLILFQTIQPFPGTAPLSDASIACRAVHGRFRDSDLACGIFSDRLLRVASNKGWDEGLVSGVRFAVDASLIEADTNRQNSTPKEEWHPEAIAPEDAPRAAREYLDTLDDAAFGAATSNASQVLAAFDYVADLALETNSTSPQPPRTLEKWHNSFRCRQKRIQHEKKRTRASTAPQMKPHKPPVFQRYKLRAVM